MKIFRMAAGFSFVLMSWVSCSKEPENRWKIEVQTPAEQVQLTDISKIFYDPAVSTTAFSQQFPWFQGTVPAEDFEKRRADSSEIKIYQEALKKIDQKKLAQDLQNLFSHIKYYFPQFRAPKVYIFSSALQMAQSPILFDAETNFLFIDLSGFLGEKNLNYTGLELYFQKSMNPENIIPKVSRTFAETIVPYSGKSQKFIDLMVYNGKVMTLQDAFLPDTPDYLKIDYTKAQMDWAKQNEANIYNYFVESNLIFGDDHRLAERFIAPAPFSKFYTEIDNQSSPMIGIFTGWQICRSFLAKHEDVKLTDFLQMDATKIFNEGGYKSTLDQ